MDEHLRELSPLTCLRRLSLRGCSRLDGSGLAHLSPLAPLTSLDLSGCSAVTDAALRALHTAAPCLTALNLSGCSAVTAAGLWALLPLEHLRRVVLQGCFGDAGLQVTAAAAVSAVNIKLRPVL